ncbi:MAG: cyanophycin synthetase [Bdellovibrionota bacterium]
MNDSRYRQVVQALEARGVMPKTRPALEPTKQGLKALGLGSSFSIDPSRAVVVAGTNGKGSVCASLEALLLSTGSRVGLYTSPHLIEHTERIRLSGKDISRDLFCQAYDHVSEKTRHLQLTHFETLTLMAAWAFAAGAITPPSDWMIFEVGLGGTWDATNAIPHAFNVISRLGFDHQNLLGETLAEIAANKFGVVGQDSTVVHSPFTDGSVASLAREAAEKTNSTWICSKSFDLSVKSQDFEEPRYLLRSEWGEAPLKLPGWRGAENTALALTAFEALGFDPGRALHALEKVQWPGRMEKVESANLKRRLYLSGDHNPQGIESLVQLLKDYPRNHLHLIVGVGREKDLDGILRPLQKLPDASLYLTETPFRGRRIQEYGEWLKSCQGAWPDPQQALQEVLRSADPRDMIVVTGSLYLVGQIRKLFVSELLNKSDDSGGGQ